MSNTNITNASNYFTRGSTGGYVRSFNWGALNIVPSKGSWTTYTGPLFNTVIPNTGLNVIAPSDDTVSVFLPRNLYIGPQGTLYVQNISTYGGSSASQIAENVVANYSPAATSIFPLGGGSFFSHNIITPSITTVTDITLPTTPLLLGTVEKGTWVVFVNTCAYSITIHTSGTTSTTLNANSSAKFILFQSNPLVNGIWYATT
jgi:hypothetical protein